jgi:hypothetical protein
MRAVKRVVRTYYSDIDSGDYHGAWHRLAPFVRSSFGGYETWRAGYKTTTSTSVIRVGIKRLGRQDAALRVTVKASDTDVCGSEVKQRFRGSWQLERHGHSWIATNIRMSKVSGDEPVTDASRCSSTTPTDTAPSSPARSGCEPN